MIPSRNVWHPLGRKPAAAAAPSEPLDQDEPADIDEEEAELSDVEGEEAELSDADYYQSLRRDVIGCREGSIPSITDAMRPRLQDRPWSKRHKIRDRHGKAF